MMESENSNPSDSPTPEVTETKPSSQLILHTLPPGKTVPNVSPFVLKLETYLRMAGITYEIDTKKPFGTKGKTPWITIDGIDLADSQLIIEFLNKKFDKSMWSNATKEERAVSQSMRIMLEDHLLCGLGEWRWVTGLNTLDQVMDGSGIKFWLIKQYVSRRVKSALETQGIGKHTPEERFHLLKEDIIAISDYLGDKSFFLGEEPTEIDCVVFGVMAQFIWGAPGSPFEKVIKEEFPAIENYCIRMKEKFWPDWDTLLHKN